mmetsp:Transcript_1471/g.3459  ORF Transcript_1471/g.3459 Transcript_1471/m.3459 type:complete len:88 (+) Transcript_1471:118-381(+)
MGNASCCGYLGGGTSKVDEDFMSEHSRGNTGQYAEESNKCEIRKDLGRSVRIEAEVVQPMPKATRKPARKGTGFVREDQIPEVEDEG